MFRICDKNLSEREMYKTRGPNRRGITSFSNLRFDRRDVKKDKDLKMLRVLTIVLLGLVLIHESECVPQRSRGQNVELKIAEAGTLSEKIQRHFGPVKAKMITSSKKSDPKWPKDVPKEFDLRTKYPKCAEQFSHAPDEGPCNTDGPSVISSILSDKYCIKNKGEKREFSADFLLRCAEKCDETSFAPDSWIWAYDYGVPTDGEYDSFIGCQPYSYKPCKHTIGKYFPEEENISTRKLGQVTDELEECKDVEMELNKCTSKCTNPDYPRRSTKHDRMRIESWYYLEAADFHADNEEVIKKEIIARGPVCLTFLLYEDFFDYKGGIYHVTEGTREASSYWKNVKAIGWGEEDGDKYWLVVNTWKDFNGGEQVFKIGINEAYIQELATSGHFHEPRHPDDESDEDEDDDPSI
nr:PREDICTED: cathepsin B-like cysteine proteinase 4 [Bemisia tabaci]